tara:strand:- start:2331 stop:5162 length:2832 start_codon:yes stop_codon:yes gene_type:complete
MNDFVNRHLGPRPSEVQEMLDELGFDSLEALVRTAVPSQIQTQKSYDLPQPLTENEALGRLKEYASKNRKFKSYLGMGYSDSLTPPVIQRGVLENPGWYTQYTPYQAEISQGRLEALLNFQTMISELTSLPVSNASLLDEGTAVAEAMSMAQGIKNPKNTKAIFISHVCHPQTIDVVRTRARSVGISMEVGDFDAVQNWEGYFAAILPNPATDGKIRDFSSLIQKIHDQGGLAIVVADLLSLSLIKTPGEMGADICVGSSQRFGVPLGYGGPHAAFLSTKDEYKRKIPGRIVGVSQDKFGRPAIRLALQTREQHIRRDKATSNICTAQVLLAVIASMYGVYHGPDGLRQIAKNIHLKTKALKKALEKMSFEVTANNYFDTLLVRVENASDLIKKALDENINLRRLDSNFITISIDEVTTQRDLENLILVFGGEKIEFPKDEKIDVDSSLLRESSYLNQKVFQQYRSEAEMLRYIKKLESKDLSLTTSMIPLGSCTMKLNAAAEMFPITWSEWSSLHPFVPMDQAQGYQLLFKDLESWLSELTGFDSVSLQPNAGSQGEYAGLLLIRKYHESNQQGHRNICLIPQSAHGTNPASAVMAGMKVVVVKCDAEGNIDLEDLKAKAQLYAKDLAALMITYPSTHGVFETQIVEICETIHAHGGQVYMDGANMNAQIGYCRPGEFGADVCHLNLHKTFCIPHGGGGPGMGPIGVASHLSPFLPNHSVVKMGGEQSVGAVSAAPWGSSSILPISWMYIQMMGEFGLKKATEVAILNANYIAKKLEPHFPVLYRGNKGLVAHECIIDLRPLKAVGIEVEDIAKRLMDYGFHAPTVSFPVAGTMMIEPTESEGLSEINRFCEAMVMIRKEVQEIEDQKMDKQNNPLKNAPHTAQELMSDSWERPYSRERAAFPASWMFEHKYWVPVSRIDGVWGDRNLICSCGPMEDWEESQ